MIRFVQVVDTAGVEHEVLLPHMPEWGETFVDEKLGEVTVVPAAPTIKFVGPFSGATHPKDMATREDMATPDEVKKHAAHARKEKKARRKKRRQDFVANAVRDITC